MIDTVIPHSVQTPDVLIHSREYGSPASAPLSLSFGSQQPPPVPVGQHPQLLEMPPFGSPLPPGAALNQ